MRLRVLVIIETSGGGRVHGYLRKIEGTAEHYETDDRGELFPEKKARELAERYHGRAVP